MIRLSALCASHVRASATVMVLSLVLAVAAPASAAQLAYWNPNGTLNGGDPLPVTSVAPGITASAMTGGPGLTSSGIFASAFMFDNWPTGALDTTKYITFSTTGSAVTYGDVTFSIYNNFDGTGNWEIRSSADGFTAALDSGAFTDIIVDGQVIVAT